MEEKENNFKAVMKRKSTSSDNETLAKRPFQISYSNLNKSVSRSSFDTSETPLCHKIFQPSTCLTANFKISCELNINKSPVLPPCMGTPNEQIVSLAEFKNLPKPVKDDIPVNEKKVEVEKKDIETRPSINKSISEVTGVAGSLNDSFGIIKYGIFKSQSITPIYNMFNTSTPETPCDINAIDLDKSVNWLPRMHEMICHDGKRISASLVESPSFQEIGQEPSRKRRLLESRLLKVGNDTINRPLFTDDTNNKIVEVSVDFASEIIENDLTSDSYVYHIIDCRYPYEYEGGHLIGAVNLYTPWQLLNYVFLGQYDMKYLSKPLENIEEAMIEVMNTIINIKKPISGWKTEAFIFHCEFSSVRGPEMARCMRNMDRFINFSCQSNIFFPKVYIMNKGYREFYRKYKELCDPSGYVKMDIKDPNNLNDSFFDDDDSIREKSTDETLDLETWKAQIKMYNRCKKESQEQLKLFSQLLNE